MTNKLGVCLNSLVFMVIFSCIFQGYINKDDAKNAILRARQRFEEILLEHKGPSIIPTVFKNHPNRFEHVRIRDTQLQNIRSVRNPPELPFYVFTFADDIFLNLICNIRQHSYKVFINHEERARFISMNEESCGEVAFKEMLSQQPSFYSEIEDIVNMSEYVEPEGPRKTDNIGNCSNTCHFIVDFSVILPELKVSTVWVYCVACGKLLETVLCDKTIQVIREEIMHNISRIEVETNNSNAVPTVLRLPLRNCCVQGCAFVEGLMGVTLLSKKSPYRPSIFVRTRLFYFCDENAKIGKVVHDRNDKDVTNPEIINFEIKG